jgi:hypothetical protein
MKKKCGGCGREDDRLMVFDRKINGSRVWCAWCAVARMGLDVVELGVFDLGIGIDENLDPGMEGFAVLLAACFNTILERNGARRATTA